MTAKKKVVKDPDDVEDLNMLLVSLPMLRMELAKLSKEGYEIYPLGDLLIKIREIVRQNNGS